MRKITLFETFPKINFSKILIFVLLLCVVINAHIMSYIANLFMDNVFKNTIITMSTYCFGWHNLVMENDRKQTLSKLKNMLDDIDSEQQNGAKYYSVEELDAALKEIVHENTKQARN